MKNNSFFVLVLLSISSFIFSCNNRPTPDNSENNTTTSTDESKKNDVKEITDGVVDVSKAILKEKHYKDSILIVTREQRWVYQIGDVMDNEKIAVSLRNKLKNISRVFVFKKSRKEFFVFKDDARSES